ncbi:phosphoglycerate mutase family protein [Gaetbulibacter aquiaggeris]|uniref:Phosphoglycerate mutase family protein n=1 Tax=Gaetbulibacter aquiaggeris TaxID=1735373 RepID=A0ABW7MU62_9FLAO
MKYLSIIILSTIILASCENKEKPTESNVSKKVSTYYFIRHAEKDRSDPTNENPHLTDIGNQRAQHWNEVFKNINFDVVYSTNYNRTKETAQPTASKNNLDLVLYDPKTIDISKFLKVTEGKTILVVGHSNTTPDLVNRILGNKKYDDIDDSNNSNLYVVTVSGDHISDNLLYINP